MAGIPPGFLALLETFPRKSIGEKLEKKPTGLASAVFSGFSILRAREVERACRENDMSCRILLEPALSMEVFRPGGALPVEVDQQSPEALGFVLKREWRLCGSVRSAVYSSSSKTVTLQHLITLLAGSNVVDVQISKEGIEIMEAGDASAHQHGLRHIVRSKQLKLRSKQAVPRRLLNTKSARKKQRRRIRRTARTQQKSGFWSNFPLC